jgi:3-hydroxymyristoyl/3-hydroxydecanoyl-(acyl carrier protein) dehydratase
VFEGRRVPRTPNGDLQLISRVTGAHGTPGQLSCGATLMTEYAVPEDAWFAQDGGAPDIPYAILMEIGLQPCGFLSGYLGTTLPFPEEDFYFRNLDGQGTTQSYPDLRGKTIANRVELRSSTTLPGVILQSFSFALSCDGCAFYAGEATFGYFSASSLATQSGLDGGLAASSWLEQYPEPARLVLRAGADGWFRGDGGVALPPLRRGSNLALLDEITIIREGGKDRLGYAHATRSMRRDDWFFAAHFYQDPVMPGSLGLEALLEALQACAQTLYRRGGTLASRVGHVPGSRTTWRYRGQIVPGDARITVEVHVTALARGEGWIDVAGEGSLWRGDLRIYEVQGLALRMWEE